MSSHPMDLPVVEYPNWRDSMRRLPIPHAPGVPLYNMSTGTLGVALHSNRPAAPEWNWQDREEATWKVATYHPRLPSCSDPCKVEEWHWSATIIDLRNPLGFAHVCRWLRARNRLDASMFTSRWFDNDVMDPEDCRRLAWAAKEACGEVY